MSEDLAVTTTDTAAVVLPEAAPTKKIAILGTTPSRLEAPIDDPTWAIWTIGPGGKDAHRWDRLYETHTVWPEEFADYLNDLSRVEAPRTVHSIVPMKARMHHWAARWKHDDEWLASKITGDWSTNVVIDREVLFERHRRMWFSTSICYAIVDAIEAGATHIGCYGIDLESDEEHISQFIGCAHFLDLARLRGIELSFPPGCGLDRDLNPYPDRYETHLALTYEKKIKLLENLLNQCRLELDAKRTHAVRVEGALMKLRELNAGQEVMKAGEEEYVNVQREATSFEARYHQLEGELSATRYFQRMYTWGMFDPGKQA